MEIWDVDEEVALVAVEGFGNVGQNVIVPEREPTLVQSLPASAGDVFQSLFPPTELALVRHHFAPGLQITECWKRINSTVQNPLHSSL